MEIERRCCKWESIRKDRMEYEGNERPLLAYMSQRKDNTRDDLAVIPI